MTVGELLERIDARELTEWQAFEVVHGPIGPEWRDNALAEVHEELQHIAYLLQAVNTEKKDQSRIPKPQRYPRPGLGSDDDGGDALDDEDDETE